MNEKNEKLHKLAKDIMILSRNTLLVNLRFLDTALSQFKLIAIDKLTILTDGKHIFYNPNHLINIYITDSQICIRNYLHIVMHCIFRHMYINNDINHLYWDLACDIAVENIINELDLKCVVTSKQMKQIKYINAIKLHLKHITAEKVYVYLQQNVTNSAQINKINELFHADNHEIWYKSDIKNEFVLSADNENYKTNDTDIISTWKSISEQIAVALQTFCKQQGLNSGAMSQNLMSVNREKYDYTTFLKKFAVRGEAMKINDDEFDYIFYTYGLNLYKKMPLIEPIEYKDIKAIREFVIAIDTSGSTSGEIVRKFIQKTYNILKSTDSFFKKSNIHIIQCDAKIQQDVKICCQKDFDEYLKNMKIYGLGGTDFRPVFEYVDKLKKEFTNFKGLIYFTDGFGTFPKKNPEYDTVFIFIDDEYNNFNIPPWAMKLVLKKEEI